MERKNLVTEKMRFVIFYTGVIPQALDRIHDMVT